MSAQLPIHRPHWTTPASPLSSQSCERKPLRTAPQRPDHLSYYLLPLSTYPSNLSAPTHPISKSQFSPQSTTHRLATTDLALNKKSVMNILNITSSTTMAQVVSFGV